MGLKFIIVILVFLSIGSHAQTPISGKSYTSPRQSRVYTFVEQMPQFPGGKDSLKSFIKNNRHYPSQAKYHNTEGTVYLTFLVDTVGSINDIMIFRHVPDGCDDEAVRIVKLMPKWIPGKNNGRTVSVQYNLQIPFQSALREEE